MKTRVLNIKSYRDNLTKIWKESQEKNERIVVTSHSKPIFEVFPVYDDNLEFERDEMSSSEKYKLAEKSFGFWNSKKDDGIFNENVKI